MRYISKRVGAVQLFEKRRRMLFAQAYILCNDNYQKRKGGIFWGTDKMSKVHSNELVDWGTLMEQHDHKEHHGKTIYLGPPCDWDILYNWSSEKMHNLHSEHVRIISNTFLKYRKRQIKTWYKWSNLGQTCQSDFILTLWRLKSGKKKQNMPDHCKIPPRKENGN